MLSKSDIKEYQEIYKKEFSKEITFEEAERQANKLFLFIKTIFRPIKSK
jgi:hypothetical protein